MSRYESRGISYLPPPTSTITREDVQLIAHAGQYATPGVFVPLDPFALFWSYNIPSGHGAPSLSLPSNGMMAFEGHGTLQIWSSSDAFVRRDFPAETYVQVKRQVNNMVKHPNEKTLKYQIKCVFEHIRRFIVRTKWKTLGFWGRFKAYVYGCWRTFMMIPRSVNNTSRVVPRGAHSMA